MYHYWRKFMKPTHICRLSQKETVKTIERILYFSEIIQNITNQIPLVHSLLMREIQKGLRCYYKKKLFKEKYRLELDENWMNLSKSAPFDKYEDYYQLYTKQYKFLNSIREQIKIQYKSKPHHQDIIEQLYHPDNIHILMKKGHSLSEIDVILYNELDNYI